MGAHILVPSVMATLLGIVLVGGGGMSSDQTIPEKSAPDPGTLNDFMLRKQRLAHQVFDAIVLKDFKRIAKDANALFDLSRAEEWQVVKTPRYIQFSSEFQNATQKLARSAREEDLNAATRGFAEVTLCCAQCHEYIRGRQK